LLLHYLEAKTARKQLLREILKLQIRAELLHREKLLAWRCHDQPGDSWETLQKRPIQGIQGVKSQQSDAS
jgi:hypothetical protein